MMANKKIFGIISLRNILRELFSYVMCKVAFFYLIEITLSLNLPPISGGNLTDFISA